MTQYEIDISDLRAASKCVYLITDENVAADLSEKLIRASNSIIELKKLSCDLLKAADKCSGEPLFMVQPFLGVIKSHLRIITKYELLG